MPTSPQRRTTETERWTERHPTLTRGVNALGALVCLGWAGLAYASGDRTTAGLAAVSGVILLAGVVWPRVGPLGLTYYWPRP